MVITSRLVSNIWLFTVYWNIFFFSLVWINGSVYCKISNSTLISNGVICLWAKVSSHQSVIDNNAFVSLRLDFFPFLFVAWKKECVCMCVNHTVWSAFGALTYFILCENKTIVNNNKNPIWIWICPTHGQRLLTDIRFNYWLLRQFNVHIIYFIVYNL